MSATPAPTVTIHFDGACQPPRGGGVAAYGFTIRGAGIDIEGRGPAAAPGAPDSTNNVAEYMGAIRALEKLRSLGFREAVRLRGDSQLVIRQMRGEYAVRSERIRRFHQHLAEISRSFASVEFEWIRRELNQRADELSKMALAEMFQGRPVGR